MKMADSGESVSKRLRRGRSANKAETSTTQQISDTESSNSMLCLNNDCLLELFERLDIVSLSQMANACKRFRPITEHAFRRCHKELVFKGSFTNSVFRRVLCKFGHMVTSIDTSEAYLINYDEYFDGNAIAKYCTNQLDTVFLHKTRIDCKTFKPIFSRLKCIDLNRCEFTGYKKNLFKNCPNLETFCFYADFFGPDPLNFTIDRSIDFVLQRFPKLKNLAFDCTYVGFWTFIELLPLNPHIKHIDIAAKSEDIFIDAITEYTKDLESFRIHWGNKCPEEQTRKGLLKLSKLKKLQNLCIEAGYEIWGKAAGPLMDAFAKAKVPIERLELIDFLIGPKDIQSILKIKTMKIMVLNKIEKAVNDADLVPLATELPLLEFLQLDFGVKVKKPITVNGLAQMAEDGINLLTLVLAGVQNLKIDEKAFEDILKAVQNRHNQTKLTIYIYGSSKKTSSFDVPENIQQAASQHLKIKYSTQQQ